MNATEFYKTIRESLTFDKIMELYANHRLETQQLWGVYDIDDNMLSVHRTEKGANDNTEEWSKIQGYVYVDKVTLHP